jgi:hypothetical protein
MQRLSWSVAVWCAAAAAARGETTPGQAANQGRTTGQAAVQPLKQGIGTANGQANVPGYSTNAVEGTYFNNGNGNLAGPTAQTLADCQASTSPDCAAIHFMQNKSSTVNPMTINSGDPLIQQNKNRASDPGSVLGGMMASFPPRPTSNCAAALPGPATPQQLIEVCASYTLPEQSTCVKAWILQIDRWWTYTCQKTGTINLLCHTNLLAQCSIAAKALSSYNAARTGAFSSASITPTATPGLYGYFMSVAYACGDEGTGTLDFSLDTVVQGGFITVNLTKLDDAAAIGVNGYTVYAGYLCHGAYRHQRENVRCPRKRRESYRGCICGDPGARRHAEPIRRAVLGALLRQQAHPRQGVRQRLAREPRPLLEVARRQHLHRPGHAVRDPRGRGAHGTAQAACPGDRWCSVQSWRHRPGSAGSPPPRHRSDHRPGDLRSGPHRSGHRSEQRRSACRYRSGTR